MYKKNTPLFIVMYSAFLVVFGTVFAQDPAESNHIKDSNKPDSIVASARNLIMHYFQSGSNDSVDVIVSRCDTFSILSREWLSGHERVLIAVLQGDLSVLKEPVFYIQNLSLRDTILSPEHDWPLPRFDPYRHDIPAYDNLSQFLERNFQQKLAIYRNRFPQDEYLWNFLDLIFDPTEGKIIRYIINYAHSPFAPLVRFNYYVRYVYRYDGIIFGAGYSFINFEKKTNALFKDRAGFTAFVEGYLRGFYTGLGLGISHKRSQSPLLIDGDTISPGVSYKDIFFNCIAGRLVSLQDRVYFCPYAGVTVFKSTPGDCPAVTIPTVWGAKIGVSVNIRLSPGDTKCITSRPVPDIGLRLDAGYQYHKFYRIRSDLGANSFYFNVALEMMAFAFRRACSVP